MGEKEDNFSKRDGFTIHNKKEHELMKKPLILF